MDQLKIYIIHYEPLIERKTYLVNEFNKYSITNYEFITSYDRNKIDFSIINQYFDKKYNKNPISKYITLAHIDLYTKISTEKDKLILILEDDAILCDDFHNKLNYYISQLPRDFECGFINNGCKLHISSNLLKENKIWYFNQNTRTCCAYMMTKDFAIKLSNFIKPPYPIVIDFYLIDVFKQLNANIYWAEPTIVSDGSETIYGESYNKSLCDSL